jgi:hypothetical protein
MIHIPDKTLAGTDIDPSTLTVPRLTSGGAGVYSRENKQIQLYSLGAVQDKPAEASTDQPLMEQSQDRDLCRNAVRATPNSYKLWAFSMIIFFNTSSSFSESTLSPLKGILRKELGVTSRFLLHPEYDYNQMHNTGPSHQRRAWPIPFYLYLVVCPSTTGVRLMLPSSAPFSSPWGP